MQLLSYYSSHATGGHYVSCRITTFAVTSEAFSLYMIMQYMYRYTKCTLKPLSRPLSRPLSHPLMPSYPLTPSESENGTNWNNISYMYVHVHVHIHHLMQMWPLKPQSYQYMYIHVQYISLSLFPPSLPSLLSPTSSPFPPLPLSFPGQQTHSIGLHFGMQLGWTIIYLSISVSHCPKYQNFREYVSLNMCIYVHADIHSWITLGPNF